MKKELDGMNHNDGQLKCYKCDLAFNNESSLARHGQMHCGTFRCTRCASAFSERKHLYKHLNRHNSSTTIKVRIVHFNIRAKIEIKQEDVKREVKDEDDQIGEKELDRNDGQAVGVGVKVKREHVEGELRVADGELLTNEQIDEMDVNDGEDGEIHQSEDEGDDEHEMDPIEPSSSSIQNNDASTNEHRNATDQHDDRESRISTADYMPRLFDDENIDSESDYESDTSVDSGVNQNDKEQEQVSDDDDDDPDYSYSKPNTSKSPKGSHSKNSTKHLKTNESNKRRKYASKHITTRKRIRTRKSSNNKTKNTSFTATDHSQLAATSNELSNSSDNVSTISDIDFKNPKPHKCPICEKTYRGRKLLHHYRWVHQEWKPYYCRWPKCNFVAAAHARVVRHADREHLNLKNDRPKAKKYVGKRDETPPSDPVLDQIGSIVHGTKGTGLTSSVCPQCGRNFPDGFLGIHIRTHKKPGYRCTWPKCGYFYTRLICAKKHVSTDHLQDKTASSKVTNRHLEKMNPKTGKTSKLFSAHRRKRLEDIQGEVQENGDNSYKCSIESNTIHESSFDCPKCEASFDIVPHLLRHYRGLHQEWQAYYCRWPKCHFVSNIVGVVVNHTNIKHFKSQNREKSRKYVGKREDTPPADPVLEKIVAMKYNGASTGPTKSVCPRCGRHFLFGHLKIHLRTHNKPGYRCIWPKCDFFFSGHQDAKQHICADHLQVQIAHSQQINKHLVKVNPKTGKTKKVGSCPGSGSKKTKDHNSDHSSDGADPNSGDNADESNLKSAAFNTNCPKCDRNYRNKDQFRQHLRTHTKSGFRCTWSNCSAFYSHYHFVRRHLLIEHFKDKLVNESQVAKHIVKVEPESEPNQVRKSN